MFHFGNIRDDGEDEGDREGGSGSGSKDKNVRRGYIPVDRSKGLFAIRANVGRASQLARNLRSLRAETDSAEARGGKSFQVITFL